VFTIDIYDQMEVGVAGDYHADSIMPPTMIWILIAVGNNGVQQAAQLDFLCGIISLQPLAYQIS